MKNINIGVINLLVSTQINESKSSVNELINILKNSPILQLEFKIINNIENKYIPNDITATRYIDNNIKLFEVYTLDEINIEHDKLKKFQSKLINENSTIHTDFNHKIQLYNSITNLIIESLSDYNDINADDIHDSFTFVLEHIKNNKSDDNLTNENFYDEIVDDTVIEIAVDKFNNKYSSLNENELKLIKTITTSDYNNIIKLYEDLKSENIKILNEKSINTKF